MNLTENGAKENLVKLISRFNHGLVR